MVGEIVATRSRCGIRSTQSMLRAVGVYVQRERVRTSLHRVDPTGVELRLKRHLHRRTYSVPCPNYLWHIDGYHKLIRWRFVIHGGVDGYSRIPVYLNVSSNNKSETVLDGFLGAVSPGMVSQCVSVLTVEERMFVWNSSCVSIHTGGLKTSYTGEASTISALSACGATCLRSACPGSTFSSIHWKMLACSLRTTS